VFTDRHRVQIIVDAPAPPPPAITEPTTARAVMSAMKPDDLGQHMRSPASDLAIEERHIKVEFRYRHCDC